MNERLTATVESALERANLLRRGATLLVALSGGADSVALLRTVCTLAAKGDFSVRAAHVEHGLRGANSLSDAEFCRALCRELKVPFTCDHARLNGDMLAPGAETRAREARYALLFSRARECGASALLLAHHRDDQAETVLSHLVRGSGAHGLAGMREASVRDGVTVVRPLLTISKADILEAMAGLPYCEDESNALLCCQRNRLRAEALPLLTLENPRAVEHMAQSAALLAMDDDCLQTMADQLLKRARIDRPPFFCVRKAPLAAAPQAVAVRALRSFAAQGLDALLSQVEGDKRLPEERALSAGDSLRMLELLKAPGGDTLNLPPGLKALATEQYVHLVRMADGAPLCPVPENKPLTGLAKRKRARWGDCAFTFAPFDPHSDPAPEGIARVAVPDALLATAELRFARPGDRFEPFGAPGGKPLRRYFTDRKVDAPFRPRVPLLCVGSEVLWVCGIGAAERTRLNGEPCTLITLSGRLPWLPQAPRRGENNAKERTL